MIVFSLLHPHQAKPIKTWTFDVCDVLRVGRASSSDIVLHSSIVSRRHLELWNHESHWELINFGANGTFVDGKPVEQLTIENQVVIRLGSAGPLLRIECQSTPKAPTRQVARERKPLPETSIPVPPTSDDPL
ncbi:MAG: FHA domain-containing protein [Geitlerinemataceae cyanobacterium]